MFLKNTRNEYKIERRRFKKKKHIKQKPPKSLLFKKNIKYVLITIKTFQHFLPNNISLCSTLAVTQLVATIKMRESKRKRTTPMPNDKYRI